MRLLLTGCTGYVGTELTRALLRDPAVERLVLVIRPQAGASGEARLARMRTQWAKFLDVPTDADMKKAVVLEHAFDGPPLQAPDGDFDAVIHSAASTDLAEALAPSRRANLYMTQKVLDLTRRLRGNPRFVHLSTAYVAGTRPGLIREDDPFPVAFHNHYERSKREAEDCVRHSGLPHTILRPSIIVGRSDDGYTPGLKVLYSVWRAWLAGVIPRAPLNPRWWVDIVPLDYVVDATRALMLHRESLGKALHLCAGDDRQRAGTIMDAAVKVFEVPRPKLAPPFMATVLRWPFIKPFLKHDLRLMLDVMYHHVPYLGMPDRQFETAQAEGLLKQVGIEKPRFAAYGETLFRFCKDTAWGKRATRKPPRAAA